MQPNLFWYDVIVNPQQPVVVIPHAFAIVNILCIPSAWLCFLSVDRAACFCFTIHMTLIVTSFYEGDDGCNMSPLWAATVEILTEV